MYNISIPPFFLYWYEKRTILLLFKMGFVETYTLYVLLYCSILFLAWLSSLFAVQKYCIISALTANILLFRVYIVLDSILAYVYDGLILPLWYGYYSDSASSNQREGYKCLTSSFEDTDTHSSWPGSGCGYRCCWMYFLLV